MSSRDYGTGARQGGERTAPSVGRREPVLSRGAPRSAPPAAWVPSREGRRRRRTSRGGIDRLVVIGGDGSLSGATSCAKGSAWFRCRDLVAEGAATGDREPASGADYRAWSVDRQRHARPDQTSATPLCTEIIGRSTDQPTAHSHQRSSCRGDGPNCGTWPYECAAGNAATSDPGVAPDPGWEDHLAGPQGRRPQGGATTS